MKMKMMMGGMKFLNRQMVPMCFQVMGDEKGGGVGGGGRGIGIGRGSRSGRSMKLVKWDGAVILYRRPIRVRELMLDFPADAYMVCRSDSFYIGQKIPALAQDDQLQLGHTYFLLPTHVFHSVLSFLTIASFTSSHPNPNSKNALLRKAATCQPFVLLKSPSGGLRIRVCEDFVSELLTEQAQEEVDASSSTSTKPNPPLCTTPQLQKDYTLLVVSRNWKPKLETIKESSKKKKKIKKLASFGIKRRKNSQSRASEKTPDLQTQTPATTLVPSRPVS